jgi:transposase
MITYSQWHSIRQAAKDEHLGVPELARRFDMSTRTIRKWLKEDYRPRKSAKRSSKLDPFKGRIMGLLDKYPYTGTQIYNILREEGFEGGVTIVRDYLQKVRPRKKESFLTLNFTPGECAQVDWGSWDMVPVGNTTRRLNFFVMVLGYSRMLYVEFSLSQSQEHFLSSHRNAFEFFGGVPAKIMCDNCKTAVISHPYGLPPVYNTRYLDFAKHYGFEARACNVRKAHEKGMVENAVGYVKHNFLAGRPITQFESLNPSVKLWLDGIANVRLHARTKRHPVDLFAAEKSQLMPLPIHPYDCATIKTVRADRQFRIRLDTNRYSVPAKYAGENLLLKCYPERICLYQEQKLVAEHLRSYERHQDFEDPEHVRPLLERKRRGEEQHIRQRFLELCPEAEHYYRKMVARKLSWRLHLRRIVALCEIYGKEKVARAIKDALHFHAFSSEYIANILEQRERHLPEPGALHLTRREDLLQIDIPTPDLNIYNIEGDSTNEIQK